MIAVKGFNDLPEFFDYLGTNELSQDGNFNAYTRLFIVDNSVVAKVYFKNPILARKNIRNIELICNEPNLHNLSALVIPLELRRL